MKFSLFSFLEKQSMKSENKYEIRKQNKEGKELKKSRN